MSYPPLSPFGIRDQLIAKGIASVEQYEKREYRRLGLLEGLEICRKLDSPEDFETVLAMRAATEREMHGQSTEMHVYWRYRCCTTQIEFIYERLKVAWMLPGPYSAQAVISVAKIISEN